MKTLKEINNSPFKPPIKKYYLGRLKHGTPYFWPMNFCSSIFKFRKLKKNTEEEIDKICEGRPQFRKSHKYKNLPMCRRSKDWIFELFGNDYWVQVGWPLKIHTNDLGWKDKWDSPRFEWSPSFMIFFFKWQFCIWWKSPKSDNFDDTYWEMFLWWKNYSNKDIEEAENTWGWKRNGISTWNKNFLK